MSECSFCSYAKKKIDELELRVMERVSETRAAKTELLKMKKKLAEAVVALKKIKECPQDPYRTLDIARTSLKFLEEKKKGE